jgi:anti-sigma B factor antagonist
MAHDYPPFEPARVLPPQSYGDACVVPIRGEIDLAVAPLLAEVLDEAVERGARSLIADLSAVTFIDSSGLGALVSCARRLDELGGELIVVADNRAVVRAMEVLCLQQVVVVEPTLTDALVAFARR